MDCFNCFGRQIFSNTVVEMITFKKTFDFYATDNELDVFVNNIFDTIIDDPEADVEVYADNDTDHRYITVNILDKVLH